MFLEDTFHFTKSNLGGNIVMNLIHQKWAYEPSGRAPESKINKMGPIKTEWTWKLRGPIIDKSPSSSYSPPEKEKKKKKCGEWWSWLGILLLLLFWSSSHSSWLLLLIRDRSWTERTPALHSPISKESGPLVAPHGLLPLNQSAFVWATHTQSQTLSLSLGLYTAAWVSVCVRCCCGCLEYSRCSWKRRRMKRSWGDREEVEEGGGGYIE